MRILWMSDSPTAPTGFGNVGRFVCAGLARLGHEVAVIGWQKHGRPLRARGYTIYPAGDDAAEATAVRRRLREFRPDVLVTLADPWRVSYIAQPAFAALLRANGVVWAHYCPIDTDLGRSRLPESTVRLLGAVDLPIAMSSYGHRLCRANGVNAHYIPHGVDTSLFCPPTDERGAKRALGYDDRFVVLSDARNQIRKMLPRVLEIFRRFAAGKDDVLLHLHCDPYDPAARSRDYCYDVVADIELLRLQEKVRFTRGMSVRRGRALAKLAALYQAADVHLLASFGEGFGLPTLQAAATGIVPLAPAHSASFELVKGHGEALRVRRFVRDGWGLRRAVVDVDHAVARLERLYRDRSLLRAQSTAAQRFAQKYDWQRIVPQWQEVLERAVRRRRASGSRRRTDATPPLVPAMGSRGHVGELVSRCVQNPSSDEVHAAIAGLERKGELTSAQVIRDSRTLARPFTVPVTPRPVKASRGCARVAGRLFLASAADVPVFQALRRIFPGLSAWSTVALELRGDAGRRSRPRFAIVSPRAFRARLSSSVLALDVAGVAAHVPALAADLGVPSVGVVRIRDQRRIWPALTLRESDSRAASERCRWILTDHDGVLAVCSLARERRRGDRTPPQVPKQRTGGSPPRRRRTVHAHEAGGVISHQR